MDDLQLTVILPPAAVADDGPSALEASLAEVGARISSSGHRAAAALEYVLSISVAAHSLLFVLQRIRSMTRQGVVIDARSADGQLVRAEPQLPPGMMVIVSTQGQVTVREDEPLTQSVVDLLSDRARGDHSGS